MEAKQWYTSKTFWFNIIGGGIEIAQFLTDAKIIPPGTATLVLAVGNIILRRLTGQPMQFKSTPKQQ